MTLIVSITCLVSEFPVLLLAVHVDVTLIMTALSAGTQRWALWLDMQCKPKGVYSPKWTGNCLEMVKTKDFKIGTVVATLSALGVIGSALRLVGPVSAYCDWVR